MPLLRGIIARGIEDPIYCNVVRNLVKLSPIVVLLVGNLCVAMGMVKILLYFNVNINTIVNV